MKRIDVEDDDDDRPLPCQGKDEKNDPCPNEAGPGGLCPVCAHQKRIQGHMKRVRPAIQTDIDANEAKKERKAARDAERAKNPQTPEPVQPKRPAKVATRIKRLPAPAPVVDKKAELKPAPTVVLPQPRPASKPATKCLLDTCGQAADDGVLCHGCHLSYRMWLNAQLQQKTCGVQLSPQQIDCFKVAAQRYGQSLSALS